MAAEPQSHGATLRITAWVCDECGYWRQEERTGVHQTSNPDDWRGKLVTHPLRRAVFMEVRDAD